jgi:hypothetical protein
MNPTRHATNLKRRRFACAWVVLGLAGVRLGLAQAPAPANSPFLPGNGSAKSDSDETIELAGVSTVGDRTDLIFHDKASKKNRWVRLGSTAEGITALKYDARLEQAVVRINGVEKVLTLRKGTGPLNAPMPPTPVAVATPAPVPAPAPGLAPTGAVAPANPVPGAAAPATPDAVARQENEARMLVSDLLEIGMAQRKAYEEAQRKAAEANGTSPATPPPATGATPAVAPAQTPLPAVGQTPPLAPSPPPAPAPVQN